MATCRHCTKERSSQKLELSVNPDDSVSVGGSERSSVEENNSGIVPLTHKELSLLTKLADNYSDMGKLSSILERRL